MKKIMKTLMAVAAVALFASCGGGNGQSDVTSGLPQKQYEGDHVSFTYPEIMGEANKLSFGEENVEVTSADSKYKISLTYQSSNACKPADLETFYNNFKGMSMYKDWTFDAPVINGNVMTFKATKGDQVENHIAYGTEEGPGLNGTFSYPTADAETYDKATIELANSIKLK